MFRIEPEPASAAGPIEAMLDRAFGPARFRKTAQRLRDGRVPADGLSLIASADGHLVGTIRFWHVCLGNRTDALLLGPVAVAPDRRGEGIGDALIRQGLAASRRAGHRAVILVGDEPYYRRFGFGARATAALKLPGPVERDRFLGLELEPGALASASGFVRPTGAIAPCQGALRPAA
jgi:predicted N-acetyltransferase YhbS